MDRDRAAILKTLAFGEAFEMPLTAYEVSRYLVRGNSSSETLNPKTVDVLRILDDLVAEGKLVAHWGYYTFADRAALIEERLARLQIAVRKRTRAERWARYIVRLPYVRGVFAYGSLALGNTKKRSDLDVLIVTAPGYIFLARLFVSLFTEMFGVRRTRTAVNDRLCLNHYVTSDALALPSEFRNGVAAWLWARMTPLAVREERLADRFAEANAWARACFSSQRVTVQRATAGYVMQTDATEPRAVSQRDSRRFRVGEAFERFARTLQLRKIARNPLTQKKGGRIVTTDAMLIFHPELPEERRMARYRERLTEVVQE